MFECGKRGHKRPECQIYKALLAKNNGKGPQGHKGAFEKARDKFRKAHPQAPRSRSGSRDSNKDNRNKDKNRKSMRPMLDADDRDSDDSDGFEAPRAPWDA